jgi:hypothetical protein
MASIDFRLDPTVLYITTNPPLTLTLTNTSRAPLTLKGGTPVPEGQIQPDGPSIFYFSFGTLITADELKAAAVSVVGNSSWNRTFFPDERYWNWGVCPATDVTLKDQESVSFKITQLAAAGKPAPGQLSIDYFNFPAVLNSTKQIQVFLQNPPSGSKDLVLTSNFLEGDTVYTTLDSGSPILNKLFFGMSNPSATQPIVTEPWGTNHPVFNITFTYSEPPGYGALTTPKFGSDISVDIVGENKGSWEHYRAPTGLYWILKPSESNPQVFAGGASLELEISLLRTDLPVGDTDLTNMYVQYANLPGYNDGFFSAQILKVPGPAIKIFYSDPLALGSAPSAQGNVYWVTENAEAVSFEGGDIGSGFFTCFGSHSATIRPEGITMTAYLNSPSKGDVGANPCVTRTLKPADVQTSSIPLPFAGVGTIILRDRTAWLFQGLVGISQDHLGGTRYASLDLDTNKIAQFDLAPLINPPNNADVTISTAAVSPDEKTFYAIAVASSKDAKGNPTSPMYLLSINAQTGEAKLVLTIPQVSSGVSFPTDLIVTPDNSTIYLNWISLAVDDNFNFTVDAGLWAISTANFQITNKNAYPQPSAPPGCVAWPPFLLGLSADGAKAYAAGPAAVASFDLKAGFKMLDQFVVPFEFPIHAILPFWDALIPDGQRAFFISMPSDGLELDLMEIDISPGTGHFSAGPLILLLDKDKPSPPAGIPGSMAFSADARRLYSLAGNVTVLDLATTVPGVQVQKTEFPWPASASRPGILAVDPGQPNKMYAAADSSWITVTVNPWPWPSSDKSVSKATEPTLRVRSRKQHPATIARAWLARKRTVPTQP